MNTRKLGRSGLPVTLVGLGCNNFGTRLDEAASTAVVRSALEEGIAHFDTAASYGDGRSEQFLGAALRGHRDEVVIATKFGGKEGHDEALGGHGSAGNVRRSCEASLGRLGTDWIDVFYLHFPDPMTPVEETAGALSDLVDEGKIGCVAASNTSVAELHAMATTGRPGTGPTAFQLEWNLLRRSCEDELVPACEDRGIGVVPFFPLASGMLTGKYRAGERFPDGSRFAAWPGFAERASEQDFAAVGRLAALTESWGRSLVELAIAWLLSHRQVSSVIAGATRPEQVVANARATDWQLSESDLAAVDGAMSAP